MKCIPSAKNKNALHSIRFARALSLSFAQTLLPPCLSLSLSRPLSSLSLSLSLALPPSLSIYLPLNPKPETLHPKPASTRAV